MGIKGRVRKTGAQALGRTAEKAHTWLWLRRNESAWQPSQTSKYPADVCDQQFNLYLTN